MQGVSHSRADKARDECADPTGPDEACGAGCRACPTNGLTRLLRRFSARFSLSDFCGAFFGLFPGIVRFGHFFSFVAVFLKKGGWRISRECRAALTVLASPLGDNGRSSGRVESFSGRAAEAIGSFSTEQPAQHPTWSQKARCTDGSRLSHWIGENRRVIARCRAQGGRSLRPTAAGPAADVSANTATDQELP